MVERQRRLDRLYGALADPTRRRILETLAAGPATITEVARPFAVSFAAVSKHVLVLERAGLVRRRVVGREHRLRLEPAPLHEAAAWLDHYRAFWEARLDALDRHLRARHAPPAPRRREP